MKKAMEDSILFLEPVCTHNIWGGTRLREDFGYQTEGDDLGECWGISAHPGGDGVVRQGKYQGMHLSEVWKKYPELFGNLSYDRFPLLVKIIDAKEDLSIQVHPDDTYAKEHENGSYGKTECWYVLDCPDNASLILGHYARDREELSDMVRKGGWRDLLREIPVKKGDFIQIDPGTIHAIKGGLLILETQQNSDITYRLYDYDRLSDGKPRKLHIRQSIDVIKVPSKPVATCVKRTDTKKKNQLVELTCCHYYRVFHLVVDGSFTFLQKYPFFNLTVTEGSGTINGQRIKKGDHFILPDKYGKISLEGQMELVGSTTGI